jgi:hypothetical protein
VDYTSSGDGDNLNINFVNSLSADNNISVVVITSQLGTYPDDVPAVNGGSGMSNYATVKSTVAYANNILDVYMGNYEEV